MFTAGTFFHLWLSLTLVPGVVPQQWPAKGDTVFVAATFENVGSVVLEISGRELQLKPFRVCTQLVVTKADPQKSSWQLKDIVISTSFEVKLEGPWLEWMHKDKASCDEQLSMAGEPATLASGKTFRLAPGQSGVVPPLIELPPVPATPLPPDFEDCALANAKAIRANDIPEFERKAAAGDAEAQFMLAEAYLNARHVERDVARGLDLHEKSAAQGYRPAQVALGERYAAGSTVPQDYQRAFKWFSAAATQGSPDAQHNLSQLYANGWGVQRDFRAAHAWMKRAAEQGHAVSQYQLGVLYSTGKGVMKDDAEAVRWIRRAAEGGHAEAQMDLGVRYVTGQGVPKDDSESLRWERLAAAQDYPVAILFLGVRHEDGRGVPRDLGMAVKYFRQAAELGFGTAMCYLGDMYQKGLGIEQSNREAYRWFFLGTAAGARDCGTQLDDARKRLNKAEREAIELEAKEWAAALERRLNMRASEKER